MITFSVSLLEKQDIELKGNEPAAILELDDDLMFNAADPVEYDLKVQKVSAGALVTGSAVTRLSGACGRCLEPVEIELTTGEFQIFLELENEEIVDITEDVRAELLINLPANLLCSEDCAGLCPVCGVNLNRNDCGCVIEDDDFEESSADKEPSPWDALDGLDLKK